MTKKLLCLGYGYCADALAVELLADGWQITGTTRDQDKLDQMGQQGVTPVLWQDTDMVIAAIEQASHILISAAPGPAGDPFLNALGPQISKTAPQLRWACYLSTIGVYGDHQGAWVDENTPAAPTTPRGKRRLTAERAWQAVPNLPLHIFRLGGIYGPGRGPFAKVRQGRAQRIVKPGQYFSRIHVDDIVQALALSLKKPTPGEIFNLCDDEPAPPQDVIAHAATMLGQPIPPEVSFDDADMSPMARSFYADNKRVRNNRMKEVLGWSPRYPTYREGLSDLLAKGA